MRETDVWFELRRFGFRVARINHAFGKRPCAVPRADQEKFWAGGRAAKADRGDAAMRFPGVP